MRLNKRNFSIGLRTAVLLIVFLLLTACSSANAPAATTSPTIEVTLTTPTPATPVFKVQASPLEIETTKNIHYADVNGLSIDLDIYAPSESGHWPVIIIVPPAHQLAEAVAAEGMVVYAIENFHVVPFSFDIELVGCAIRFAKETAASYGGDAGWITLIGDRPGATSGLVAALAGDEFKGEECVVKDGFVLPNAFIGFEGNYDLATHPYRPSLYDDSQDHTLLKDEDPELWKAIDPYTHISKNPELQIRLVHGKDHDSAWFEIPPQVSIDLHKALVDAGYDATLTIVDGAHNGDLYLSSSEAFKTVVQQAVEVTQTP